MVSAADSPSGGPWLESRSGHLQDWLDSVVPRVQSSVTFVNSQLVAFWQVFFFLLITVFEWNTLKVAGKEKCALNLQTFHFSNVRGQ